MSFWEDMSPAVKRYIAVAVIVVVGVIAFRRCVGPESESEPPPRGAQS